MTEARCMYANAKWLPWGGFTVEQNSVMNIHELNRARLPYTNFRRRMMKKWQGNANTDVASALPLMLLLPFHIDTVSPSYQQKVLF